MKLFTLKISMFLMVLLSFGAGAAESVFSHATRCEPYGKAPGSCSLALDADGYILDASSGKRLFDDAEYTGAMFTNALYRSGEQYILDSENYSSAKSRRWVVFSYDGKEVVLNHLYIFSQGISMQVGPYWHGYDCRPVSAKLGAHTGKSLLESAADTLCKDAEANVVTVVDPAPASSTAASLAVSVPVYSDGQRNGAATYVFEGTDEPELLKLACDSGCGLPLKETASQSTGKVAQPSSNANPPTVIKQQQASLLGDASRQNVSVLSGGAGADFRRLQITPEHGTGNDILLDTAKALPLIKSQYSSAMSDIFSVHIISNPAGVLKAIDPQNDTLSVKQPSAEAGNNLVLVSSEEDNAVYNFNLVFRYNKSSRQFELKHVLQVVNNESCDHSVVSVEEVPKSLIGEMSLASFDGRKLFEQLSELRIQAGSEYKKLMMTDVAEQLDKALALYRKGQTEAVSTAMANFLMDGGSGHCNPDSYIAQKYDFAQMPGWSNDLGFLFGETGNYEESIELLNAVIARNPTRTVAYLNLADSYWGLKNKARAAQAYTKYASLMSDAGKASKIPARVAERSNGVVE
ncbi:bacterial transcriptional activator domain-containing protein [Pseudomonas frederiksbergensis]|uniref:bacterial transcriptional activator domain-containing protein n=1 Tax=Pseudomonas frederiksbergensis TaxID=104087 RepID=UPI00223AFEAE|nr:bacterial transcriptional activator domain-containing protein [Pseudomonas frederiksbergensis]